MIDKERFKKLCLELGGVYRISEDGAVICVFPSLSQKGD